MELVNIRDIFRDRQKYENTQVTIGGWVRSNRNSKNFGFIVVNDGTFFEPIQVVYGDGIANYDEVAKINDVMIPELEERIIKLLTGEDVKVEKVKY